MSFVDLHVHTAPSLLPRHLTDHQIAECLAQVDIDLFVLKAHEGSTAARAQLVGPAAVGSIVLNSSVGGCNPDAVETAALLGARVVWMPTVSARAHQLAADRPELAVHQHVALRPVPVVHDRMLLDGWHDVLDVVAHYDMVLASGHLSMDETLVVFDAAKEHGVGRLLVTHPYAPFLGWRPEHAAEFQARGAYLEVGVLHDDPNDYPESDSARLIRSYPTDLLVLGSDLGHADYAMFAPRLSQWFESVGAEFGSATVNRICDRNGRGLVTQ